MKYGSKKEAKLWAYEAFRGKLVSTIPTPFDDDLEIHEKDLRNLVRYVMDVNSDAIFITGNVGEFNSLTLPERKRVAEIVIDEVGGQIPVIVQTAHHVAKDCIDLSLPPSRPRIFFRPLARAELIGRNPTMKQQSFGFPSVSMNRTTPLYRVMSFAMLSFLIYTTPGNVAVAQEEGMALEEIVVTARKREESLQDTPISIAAFTGLDLERQHIDRLDGIARSTPNLVFNTGNFTSGTNASASVWIRGIGQNDSALTTDPGVGIYLDGAYVGTSIGSVLDLVDIERVEVLRGPQGTLFGRNTIGGAISVTSKLPDDQFHGDLKVTTGSYDRIDARGSVNLPITDTLFAKVSAATFNRDGFVDTPNAQSSGKLGDIGREAFRGALRFVPNGRFEANFTADYSRVRENSVPHVRVANFLGASLADIAARRDPTNPAYRPPPLPVGRAPSFFDLYNILTHTPVGQQGGIAGVTPGVVPNPAFGLPTIGADGLVDIQHDKLVNPSFMDFSTETDVWGLAFDWNYDFGWATLKSITSYREMEAETAFDHASVPVEFVQAQARNSIDSEQLTQEFQLTGTIVDGRLNWLLGFYHFELSGLDLNDIEFTAVRVLSGSKVDDRSDAGFAQLTFDVTDKLSVTGGIRYTDESKKFILDDACHPLPKGPATLFDGTVVTCAKLQTIIDPKFVNAGFQTFVNAPVFPAPGGRFCCLPIADVDGNVVGLLQGVTSGSEVMSRGTTKRNFSNSTILANIAYHWTDDFMTYISYSEGFKAGGFVQRVFPPKTGVPFFDPETAAVYEAGLKWTGFDKRVRASAVGFHTEYDNLQILVNDGIAPVTRNAGAAEIDGFELEVTAVPAFGWLVQGGVGYLDAAYTKLDPRENFAVDLRSITLDSKLTSTPKWSTSLSAQYSHEVPNFGGSLIGRVGWSYRSEIFNDAANFPELRQAPLHLLDLALTYVSARENWEVSVFGKNITDERYLVSGAVNALSWGLATAQVGRPREWGLSFNYLFGN